MPAASLHAPNDALAELLAPDGYYKYLGVCKPSPAAESSGRSSEMEGPSGSSAKEDTLDEDTVKKAYRRLSRKHHPDKPGGDADTFRMLNRAQKVLLNPKLRQQYDILGIDLDDDEEEHADNNHHDHPDDKKDGNTAQGIVHEIASMALTTIVQLGVRTRTYLFSSDEETVTDTIAHALHPSSVSGILWQSCWLEYQSSLPGIAGPCIQPYFF
jgi:hypothetical protein